MKLMGIELINRYKGSKFIPFKSEYFKIDFETDDFIVYRLHLEPGQSTGFFKYNSPGVFVSINGTVDLKYSRENLATPLANELRSGEYLCFDYFTYLCLTNVSNKRFEGIVVVFK